MKTKVGSATEAVKKHLQRYGKINQLQALERYGTWRLSAVIHALRNLHGMKIETELKSVTTRYGAKTNVAIYRLVR